MITDERISTFIHSLDTGNTPFLTELERYAKETNVPVIRPQMQSFLKVLLAMQQPKQIRGGNGHWFFCVTDGGIWTGRLPYYNN